MSRTNDLRPGTRVRVLPTFGGNVLDAEFPGWGADNYGDFLRPPTADMTGVVRDVEKHGSNPWTRYSLRFDDGSGTSGAVLGKDFEVVSA